MLRVTLAPDRLAGRVALRLQAVGARRLDLRDPLRHRALLASHDDAARRLADEDLGDRAEQEALEATRVVRPNDEDVGIEVGRQLDDGAPRDAEPEVAGGAGAVLLREVYETAEQLVTGAQQLTRSRETERRAPDGDRGCRQGVDDVHEVQLGVRKPSQRRSQLDDALVHGGVVDGGENDGAGGGL
jgi:hypothetical protein